MRNIDRRRRIGALCSAICRRLGRLAADAEHGKVLYQACVACHTERPDALGPSLKGVVRPQVRGARGFPLFERR